MKRVIALEYPKSEMKTISPVRNTHQTQKKEAGISS
jgi:hypothetical protein